MLKRLTKSILVIFAALFITLPFISAFAHSGRTDSKGGHNNHSSNSYHYHHGYSAHQHDDGYCPIEPDNERYYSEFYKFKMFLAKIPKEFICITPIVIILLLAPLFCYIFKKKQSSKEESVLKTEEPQKSENQNSLPEGYRCISYKRELDSCENKTESLNQSYIVGEDIPEGNTVFSARSKRGGHITIHQNNNDEILREYIDFKKSFYVYLKTGEKVNSFNCRWKSINAPTERSETE